MLQCYIGSAQLEADAGFRYGQDSYDSARRYSAIYAPTSHRLAYFGNPSATASGFGDHVTVIVNYLRYGISTY